MRLKNIKYAALGIVVLISSCNKESKLNPVPTTLISDISAFETADRIANQVNGLYATFKGSGFWGTHYIYYSEARAGDFVATNLNPTRGALSYMMTVDPATSDVSTVWRQGYQIVNACNVFIEGMATKGKDVVSSELNSQYVAEAHFLRAITYYYLLQLYAQPYTKDNGASPGLPLRLTANQGLMDYNLTRSSVADVYKQILNDLTFAETNLPLKYSTAAINTTRAHRNTAIAAKTNVYLSMKDYGKVILEANKIVSLTAPFVASSGVPFQLIADIKTIFKAPYSSLESILSMPFTSNDVPGTSLGNAYIPDGVNATGLGSAGTGDFYLFAGGILSDPDWKPEDSRRAFVFKTTVGVNAGRQWCVKYPSGSPYVDHIPVMRYSQVLLNLAEALAATNGLDARAIALLNAVRKRSDPSTLFIPANQTELLKRIVNERHIEFLGEGVRNADLMRLGLPVPAKTPSGASPVPQVNPGDPNYIWPIPNDESLYNKNI